MSKVKEVLKTLLNDELSRDELNDTVYEIYSEIVELLLDMGTDKETMKKYIDLVEAQLIKEQPND